jgi:hypothetical protein
MTRSIEDKRLELTSDIAEDDQALELVSAWYVGAKAKVFTRVGTRLDGKPQIWAEILIGVIENISEHMNIQNSSKEECAREISNLIQNHFTGEKSGEKSVSDLRKVGVRPALKKSRCQRKVGVKKSRCQSLMPRARHPV